MTTITYRGYKTQVLYGDETAYATGGTANTAIQGKIQTLTLNLNNNNIRTLGLGEGRNETFVGVGNFETSWSMDTELAGFDFLRYAIGCRKGAGTTASPHYLEEKDLYDYDSGSDKGLKTFKLEIGRIGDPNQTTTIPGCVINTVGLNLTIGQTLQANLEGFGKMPVYGTSMGSFTADTTKPWIFAQGNFKWGETSSEAKIARVTTAAINIALNYDPEAGRELGSRFPEAMEPGLRKYDFTLTVKSTSDTRAKLIEDFLSHATQPTTGIGDASPNFADLILDLSEGSTAGKRNAQIKLTNCAINDISEPIEIGQNIIEYTINGHGMKGTTHSAVAAPIKYWSVSS